MSTQPHSQTAEAILIALRDVQDYLEAALGGQHQAAGFVRQRIQAVLEQRYPLAGVDAAIRRAEGLLSLKSVQPAERRGVTAILAELRKLRKAMAGTAAVNSTGD